MLGIAVGVALGVAVAIVDALAEAEDGATLVGEGEAAVTLQPARRLAPVPPFVLCHQNWMAQNAMRLVPFW